jgi:hypothetical protein
MSLGSQIASVSPNEAFARPPGHGGRQVSLHRRITRPFERAFTHTNLDMLLARIADREPHLRLAA